MADVTPDVDYSIAEPSCLIVTKRSEIRATLRRESGAEFYFLEDSVRGKYFRLGTAEYAVFMALDGIRTLAEAAAMTASSLGPRALTQEQVVAVARWLIDAGLASTSATTAAARVESDDRRRNEARFHGWNPWFLRFSCGSPENWLTFCRPLGDLLFRRDFFVAWCFIVVAALGIVVHNGNELFGAVSIELGPHGALQLLAAWCVLKLIHETAHGLACRRFGGRPGSWGAALIMGMPSPYIEVSSVWRFPDKYQRIIVSLAGVYAELLVAAVAVFVWALTDDGVVRQLTLAIATVSSVATMLFNLNPLMRFDGYFALTDWLERPNLASAAAHELRRAAKRYLLGWDERREPVAESGRLGLLMYGLGAVVWRWFVAVGLLLLCLERFGGWVTLAFSVLPLTYVVRQLTRSLVHLLAADGSGIVNFRRLAWTYGTFAVAATVWLWLFDPRQIEFPAVVEYRPLTLVRATTPGFVEEIFVDDGVEVEAGAAIARLRNDELGAEVEQARNLVEQSTAKSRMHRQAGEIAKEQGEAARRRALESKLHKLEEQQVSLVIRAPAAGRIVSRGLRQLIGRHVNEGEQLAVIGDESQKEVIAAVGQAEAALFEASAQREVLLDLSGRRTTIAAADVKLDPRVELALLHPALSVEHGGTVPVVRRERPQADGQSMTIEPEHAEPYLRLHGVLNSVEAVRMQAGRTAAVYARTTWGGLLSLHWSSLQRRLNESFQ